ncbi:MAG: hypothetical protein JXB29_08560 [Sedimentisphaerales bacterium]|nr:hypothetical protein [Sedimentisphaerales bacterium]
MDTDKDSLVQRYKWHILIVGIVFVGIVSLSIFTNAFKTSAANLIMQLVWFFAASVLLVAAIMTLTKIFRISAVLEDNGAKLEKIAEALEKNRSVLTKINQSTRLSEAAKTIVFRDADRQSLREIVFDKLQQHDFKETYEIVDEIASHPAYKQLAEQLRLQTKKFQDATDQERTGQVIEHIEKLLDNYAWARASVQIERLIKNAPNNAKAKSLRQKLFDKKQQRKKVLLEVWDDAVKRHDIDRNLEILRELDMYLTANEGLALQEAARDVFITKLHNLGVQFSLAVSGQQWAQALETGRQIIRDFPNSKMAEEIRGKWEILKQKV